MGQRKSGISSQEIKSCQMKSQGHRGLQRGGKDTSNGQEEWRSGGS